MLPRLVLFSDGIAICAGEPCHVNKGVIKVMLLPGDNPEFIDYDVRGKTEDQILTELKEK
jgi:hypothetical protein